MIKHKKLAHFTEASSSVIYPIYLEQKLCPTLVEELGYDPVSDIDAEYGVITTVNTLSKLPFKNIYFLGLGKEADITTSLLLQAFGKVVKAVKEDDLVVDLVKAHTDSICSLEIAALFTEAAIIADYKFTKITAEPSLTKTFDLLSDQDISATIDKAVIVASAVNNARTLGNTPSNLMTPLHLADYATKLASECGLELTVYGNKELKEMGAGALLGVNQGSAHEARLIVLKYNGAGDEPYSALVGKGLTFDSGGYNLKPSNSMTGMKFDMSGGGNVLSAIEAISKLKLKANVYAVVPATENMISGEGYKCDDVLVSLSGKTIEVTNTDAEGRIIMSDAFTYIQNKGATKIIDVATLTGACMVALGDAYTGAFSNDDEYVKKFIATAKLANEKVWHMPIGEEYAKVMKTQSVVADIVNSDGRMGGASMAAEFLHQFVNEGTSWIHLDIAGTASVKTATDLFAVGATGVMVKSLTKMFE